jgi:hypothetical protein
MFLPMFRSSILADFGGQSQTTTAQMTHVFWGKSRHLPTWADAGADHSGGEGGIRTLDTLASMPHFECGAFNHSATSPYRSRCRGRLACSPTFRCDQGLSPAYSGGRTAGADHPPPAGGRAASGAWDTYFRLQVQNYVPEPAYVRDRRDDRSLSFSISCVSM